MIDAQPILKTSLLDLLHELRDQAIYQHQGDPVIAEARRIVSEHFASSESLGSLRLREHRLWREGMAIVDFLSAIRDLLPSSAWRQI